MKRWMLAAFCAGALAAGPASAEIIVPMTGDTGWRTYATTLPANEGFTGTVIIGVANEGDEIAPSRLLLDNFFGVTVSGDPDLSFESGSLADWNLTNGSATTSGIVNSTTASSGTTYAPKDGSFFAELVSENADMSSIPGMGSLNDFLSAYGLTAYNGAYLKIDVTIEAGATAGFDWAFLADETDPGFYDLAFLWVRADDAAPDDPGDFEILARIGTVPEPAPLALLAAGMMALGLIRRRG